MTYDIHELWGQNNLWTGPFLKGHTNITEIEEGLDLLWQNGVSPDKVVMGFGFYGKNFTMEDVSCSSHPTVASRAPDLQQTAPQKLVYCRIQKSRDIRDNLDLRLRTMSHIPRNGWCTGPINGYPTIRRRPSK